jgi:sugar transferase (PEP-CTERM system associated)
MKLFGVSVSTPIAVLATADFLVFLLAGYFSPLLTRQISLGEISAPNVDALQFGLLFALIMHMAMAIFGLYSLRLRSTMSGILVRQAAATFLAVLGLTVLAYLFPELDAGLANFTAAAFLALVMSFTYRLVLEPSLGEQLFKRRVLVLGAGRRVASLLKLRRRSDQRGFTIVGYMPVEGENVSVGLEHLFTPGDDLATLARDQGVHEIVVAMDDRRRGFPIGELLECRLDGVEITQLVSFLERETGKVDLSVLDPSWIIFSPGFNQNYLRRASKRMMDLAFAFTLLILLSPLMFLVGVAVWVGGGFDKPVLFRQPRIGLDGIRFTLFKFRTMAVGAEADGPRWASRNDYRVTRLGRWLRRTRLDELPQLINVLKGEMSLVGPRPEQPAFVSRLNEMVPYYRERHCVKPGITGWAQLCYPYGSSEEDAIEKLKFDLYYAKNQSLIFDLVIIMQTIEVVLFGKGAR